MTLEALAAETPPGIEAARLRRRLLDAAAKASGGGGRGGGRGAGRGGGRGGRGSDSKDSNSGSQWQQVQALEAEAAAQVLGSVDVVAATCVGAGEA